MENDILDDFNEVKSIKNAKQGFWLFISTISILLSGVLFTQVSSQALFIYIILGICSVLFPMIGLRKSIKSIQNNEPSFWMKYIGLIGNLLFCLFTLSLFIPTLIDIFKNL